MQEIKWVLCPKCKKKKLFKIDPEKRAIIIWCKEDKKEVEIPIDDLIEYNTASNFKSIFDHAFSTTK